MAEFHFKCICTIKLTINSNHNQQTKKSTIFTFLDGILLNKTVEIVHVHVSVLSTVMVSGQNWRPSEDDGADAASVSKNMGLQGRLKSFRSKNLANFQ